jgi:hypothetical protein
LREILYRAIYFISLDDISVVSASFDLVLAAFDSLRLLPNSDGKGDPLLMSIHDAWGVILARLGKANVSSSSLLEIGGGAGGGGDEGKSEAQKLRVLKKTWFDDPASQRRGKLAGRQGASSSSSAGVRETGVITLKMIEVR